MSIEKQAGPFRRLERLLAKRDRLLSMSEDAPDMARRLLRDSTKDFNKYDRADLKAVVRGEVPRWKRVKGELRGDRTRGNELLMQEMLRQVAALKKPIANAETRAASMILTRPSLKPLLQTTKKREGETAAEHALRVVRGEKFMDDAKKLKLKPFEVDDLALGARERQRSLLQQITSPTEKQQAQALMQDLFNRQRRGIVPRPQGATKQQDLVTRSRAVLDRTKVDPETNKRVIDPKRLSPEEKAVYHQAQAVLNPEKYKAKTVGSSLLKTKRTIPDKRDQILGRSYPKVRVSQVDKRRPSKSRMAAPRLFADPDLREIAKNRLGRTVQRTEGEDKLISAANREVLFDATKRLEEDELRQQLLRLPKNERFKVIQDLIDLADRRSMPDNLKRLRARTRAQRKDTREGAQALEDARMSRRRVSKFKKDLRQRIDRSAKTPEERTALSQNLGGKNPKIISTFPEQGFSGGISSREDLLRNTRTGKLTRNAAEKFDDDVAQSASRSDLRAAARKRAIERRLKNRRPFRDIEDVPTTVFDRGLLGQTGSLLDDFATLDVARTRNRPRPLVGDTTLPPPISDMDSTVRRLADADDSYLSFRRPGLRREATKQRQASQKMLDDIKTQALEDALRIERQMNLPDRTPPTQLELAQGSTFARTGPFDGGTISNPSNELLRRMSMDISPRYRGSRTAFDNASNAISPAGNTATDRRNQAFIMSDVVNNPEYAYALKTRAQAAPKSSKERAAMTDSLRGTQMGSNLVNPNNLGFPKTPLGETASSMATSTRIGDEVGFKAPFPFEEGMMTGAEQAANTARVEALSNYRNVMTELKQSQNTRQTIQELGQAADNMMGKMFGSSEATSKALPKPKKA